MLHLVGPGFALSVACLSRSTARDLLRVAMLEEAAFADPLTSLANRRRFDQELANDLRHALRTDAPLSLIVLDVDRFKQVNDAHGHAGGDATLRAVAALVAARSVGVGLACRTGGEEFAVIVPGLPPARVARVADLLRRDVAAAEIGLPCGGTARVTASLGVATLQPGEDAQSFTGRADAALYDAKNAGRDLVRTAA